VSSGSTMDCFAAKNVTLPNCPNVQVLPLQDARAVRGSSPVATTAVKRAMHTTLRRMDTSCWVIILVTIATIIPEAYHQFVRRFVIRFTLTPEAIVAGAECHVG